MYQLHVLQAEFGDCLVLEFGTVAQPRYVLVDGGPPTTYERHLRAVLKDIKQAGHDLDLVMLSHVDNDHVVGLMDYFVDLRAGTAGLPKPGALWHNSFGQTVGRGGGRVEPRLKALITASRSAAMMNGGLAVNGIAEGHALRTHALALGVSVNRGFPDGLITVDSAPGPVRLSNLEMRVVGPTETNLDELNSQWAEWLDEQEGEIGEDDVFVMANSDRSVPNLSSIMVLAKADGKSILLTGDGRSDHLLTGLGAAGLLDSQGKLHVDLLKLAHHGSDRNVTKTFFKKVTADTYVASANGKDKNPDLATLIWLVETAREAQRKIKIVVTNRTPSTKKIVEEYPPDEWGYELQFLQSGRHEVVIPLSG